MSKVPVQGPSFHSDLEEQSRTWDLLMIPVGVRNAQLTVILWGVLGWYLTATQSGMTRAKVVQGPEAHLLPCLPLYQLRIAAGSFITALIIGFLRGEWRVPPRDDLHVPPALIRTIVWFDPGYKFTANTALCRLIASAGPACGQAQETAPGAGLCKGSPHS